MHSTPPSYPATRRQLRCPPSSADPAMASFSFFTAGSLAPLLVVFAILLLDAATTLSHCLFVPAVVSVSGLPLPHKSLPISSPRKCSTHVIKGSKRTVCAPVLPPLQKSVKRPAAKTRTPPKRAPVVVRRSPKASAPKVVRSGAENLSNDFYATTCPNVEAIIHNKVAEWVRIDRSLAASLLRLHFHDCMATGNDASILLTDPVKRSTEMYSVFSKGLRGFNVVDDIKLAVEKACPGVVSCADVLTVIAREVSLELGGPFWFVPFGRKDSLTSRIEDAVLVPHQESDANTLLKQFEAVGLSFSDLATLSGAHSVGRSHCFSFTGGGAAGANPRMNATYAKILQRECRPGPWEAVFNDPDTPFTLDLQYYTNLKRGMGLFESDNSIYAGNALTSSMVDAFLTQEGLWEAQFAVSMVNLGNVNVLTGPNQGEIRRVCSVRNPTPHSPQH